MDYLKGQKENLQSGTMDYLYGQKENFDVVENYAYDKPKNIVICFDGSGGKADWAVQGKAANGEHPLYDNVGGLSNICKLHLIAGGNIGNSRNYFENQLPFYYSGVGTRGTSTGKIIRNFPGISSGFAMEHIATLAWNDLEKVYKEGDKLFIFGFSRGAATARLFASHLQENPCNGCHKIDFLGVFDTVVQSLKYTRSNSIKALDIINREDSSMPDIVEKAVHFVGIDEYRQQMNPTLFNEDPKNRVTEIWAPGCHSDIGGGYYHDGISDTLLNCMRMEAEKAGLKCREITEEMCKNADYNIVDPADGVPAEEFSNFDKDMKVEPDALDPDVHDEYNIGMFSYMYRASSWMYGFNNRNIVAMKDDKPTEKPILLLDIAVERVKKLQLDKDPGLSKSYVTTKYRPEHLKGVKYRVVNSTDMSISDEVYVIEDEVEW